VGEPERVGVFGGSFNPPHVSHVLAVTYAKLVAELDRVLVIPVYQHPFSKELAPFEIRLTMARAAFQDLHFVEVSDVERELGGESKTLRTLEHLAVTAPTRQLRLIVGSDVLGDLPKWHRFDRIRELAPPLFLERAGHPSRPGALGVLPEVSSSEIRGLFRTGGVEAEQRLADLVPREVLRLVRSAGLYA
jgi:nicotinate-nucleotide adenylyltransferase